MSLLTLLDKSDSKLVLAILYVLLAVTWVFMEMRYREKDRVLQHRQDAMEGVQEHRSAWVRSRRRNSAARRERSDRAVDTVRSGDTSSGIHDAKELVETPGQANTKGSQ